MHYSLVIATKRRAAMSQSIMFVSGELPDWMPFITSQPENKDVKIFLLNDQYNGLKQINDILVANNFSGVDAIHILTHGYAGGIIFSSAGFTEEALAVARKLKQPPIFLFGKEIISRYYTHKYTISGDA